ncbi:unnamed protein product, partial [Effrenium voratum]
MDAHLSNARRRRCQAAALQGLLLQQRRLAGVLAAWARRAQATARRRHLAASKYAAALCVLQRYSWDAWQGARSAGQRRLRRAELRRSDGDAASCRGALETWRQVVLLRQRSTALRLQRAQKAAAASLAWWQ